jgi:hypothetical protein
MKKYLSHKIAFLVIFTLSLVTVFYIFLNRFSFPDANWKLGKDNKIELSSEKSITQKFIASRDGLSRIDFLFSQSDKKKIGGKIKMQIAESNCASILREGFLKVVDLNSENASEFIFSKIDDSKNKEFCLLLIFVSEKESKQKPQIFVVNNELSENKGLFDANAEELKNQSLAMRPAYQNESFWKNAEELNQRISQYKPFFLKHYYLCVAFLIFIFLIISTVFILIII